jgi:hypothetical protein
MASKHSMPAADVDKTALKSANTTVKTFTARCVQHSPPPHSPADAPPPPPPLAQAPIGHSIRRAQRSRPNADKVKLFFCFFLVSAYRERL